MPEALWRELCKHCPDLLQPGGGLSQLPLCMTALSWHDRACPAIQVARFQDKCLLYRCFSGHFKLECFWEMCFN